MVKAKSKKHLRVVSFDEEIVTKDSADKLLLNIKHEDKIEEFNDLNIEDKSKMNSNGNNDNAIKSMKKRNKNKKVSEVVDQNLTEMTNNENEDSHEKIKVKSKKRKSEPPNIQNIDEITKTEMPIENSVSEQKKVKRKKKKDVGEVESAQQSEGNDEVSVENPKIKSGESIRAQKRKKLAKLMEEKRLKADLTGQQNALNYLSKWKHCRNEWKFEKLKQIWLQQNLFDASKIPNEFWESALEYFSGSKGFIRNVVLRDALKIIEKEDNSEEENTDENYLLILQRARDIVQHLQE